MYIKIISPVSSESTTTGASCRQHEQPISKKSPSQLLDQQQNTVVQSPSSLPIISSSDNFQVRSKDSVDEISGGTSRTPVTSSFFFGNNKGRSDNCNPFSKGNQKYYSYKDVYHNKAPDREKDTRKIISYVICNSNNKTELNNGCLVNKVSNESKRKLAHQNDTKQKQNDQVHEVNRNEDNPFFKRICISKDCEKINTHPTTEVETCITRLSDCIKDYRIEINQEKRKLKSLKRTLARLEEAYAESTINQNQEQANFSDEEEDKDSSGDDEEEKHFKQTKTVELYQQLIKYAQEQLYAIQSL